MNDKIIDKAIDDLTIVQILLQRHYRDHNGKVLQEKEIKQLQKAIDLLLDLKHIL